MGYFVNEPTYLTELDTPRMSDAAAQYNATLRLASFGTPVLDTVQNHIAIDAGGGTIAERGVNLNNGPQFYDGDFSLSYLPVIERVDPYLQGFRR